MKTINNSAKNQTIAILTLILIAFVLWELINPLLAFTAFPVVDVANDKDLLREEGVFVFFFARVPLAWFLLSVGYWILIKTILVCHSFLLKLIKIPQINALKSLLLLLTTVSLSSLSISPAIAFFQLTSMLPLFAFQLWGLKKNVNFVVKTLRLY